MHSGVVLFWKMVEGYGFILRDDGENVFVHHRDVPGLPGRKMLGKGQRVEFEIGEFRGKPTAKNVRPEVLEVGHGRI